MPILLILTGLLSYFTRPRAGLEPLKPSQNQPRTVKVASKNFTEQLILSELMAQLIEAKTDFSVERRFNLGGTMICHGALVNGEIDLYAEYTGTGLTAILEHPVISDPGEAFRYVANAYHERFGVRWLKPFGFNNTYAITVRAADAKRHGWTRISDLIGVAPRLRAGFTAEFSERPDGYPGLRQIYGMQFGEVRDLDPSLMYEAVAKGEVDVVCAFATDGRIVSYNLKPLEDDRRFFPPYHAAPVIREEIFKELPEVSEALSVLEGLLDNEAMQRLNFEVDGKKQSPARVVKAFLRSQGLLGKKP
jgi:glycine betaine/choline ABC-type transport system substrate-binding protein